MLKDAICLFLWLFWAAATFARPPQSGLTFKDCQAQWTDSEIRLQNSFIARHWRLQNGLLVNLSLKDLKTGREKLLSGNSTPSPAPEFKVQEVCRQSVITADTLRSVVVESPYLLIKVRSEYISYTLITFIKIYPHTPAISTWIRIEQRGAVSTAQTEEKRVVGIETAEEKGDVRTDLCEHLILNHVHQELSVVTLMDHTDDKDNLVQVNRFLLTNPQNNDFTGNLFILEDQFNRDGLVFLKEAPLPYARPVKAVADLRQNSSRFAFTGLGAGSDSVRESYPLTVMVYQHGRPGRIRVVQQYQRRFRNYEAARDELIWHSIWGDRNRDGRMTEEFLKKEIALNRKIGIDHLYFIDGWQNGPSSNSVNRTQGGLWENQWSVAGYWEPNRKRFPHGFDDLVTEARNDGFKIGFWYNPDKTRDYANWRRDTDLLLSFHRRFGANYFKFDGVEFFTKRGEANLLSAMQRIVEETGGRAGIEIDISAGLRTGYFAAMSYGTLFLENRYTDFRRYYPHTTLRNLWQLAHYVDPRRMRIEFLNPDRNRDKYPNDPLAPYQYPKDYGLAVTLFAKPMAWFESSGLSQTTRLAFSRLLAAYKPHQSAIHQGTIYPVGEEPTGFAWTGFQSVSTPREGYVVLFRELTNRAVGTLQLVLEPGTYQFVALAGTGASFRATVQEGEVTFSLPQPRSYVLYHYRKLR